MYNIENFSHIWYYSTRAYLYYRVLFTRAFLQNAAKVFNSSVFKKYIQVPNSILKDGERCLVIMSQKLIFQKFCQLSSLGISLFSWYPVHWQCLTDAGYLRSRLSCQWICWNYFMVIYLFHKKKSGFYSYKRCLSITIY